MARPSGQVLPYYFCEHGAAAWVRVAMSLAGAKHCVVRQVECQHRGAPHCRWTLSWAT